MKGQGKRTIFQFSPFIVGLSIFLVSVVPETASPSDAHEAWIQTHIDLQGIVFPGTQADSTQSCFDGSSFALVNPGCFVTGSPAQPGDCSSSSSQFLVQYLFPDFPVPQRLRGFGFLSNDGDTVFPAAGALLLPLDGGGTRFPTSRELSRLAVENVRSNGDTSRVFVDLRSQELVIEPGSPVALVLILQFPDGGSLQAPTQGPGVAAERSLPNEGCDFFTVDAGRSGVWFEPAYDMADPQSVPLDWAFVAFFDPVGVGIESLSWSMVKQLYRSP